MKADISKGCSEVKQNISLFLNLLSSMFTQQAQRKSLNAILNEMQCVDDALPVLKAMFNEQIDEIKVICQDKIKLMDQQMIRHAFYNAVSIESILPKDLIQHILTFSQSINNNLVSNTFRECHSNNKAIDERKRLSAIIQFSGRKFGAPCNNTWIIRQNGPLNDDEIQKGYFWTDDFEEALELCLPGDKLIVDGQRQASSDVVSINKNLFITGMSGATLGVWTLIVGGGALVYVEALELVGDWQVDSRKSILCILATPILVSVNNIFFVF